LVVESLKRTGWLGELNCWWKGRRQEQRANEKLEWYLAQAEEKGIAVPGGKEIPELLRKRLQRRGVEVQKKQQGELHIFLIYYQNSWEGVLAEALEPFGRVSRFECFEQGYKIKTGSKEWIDQREGLDRDVLDVFEKANKEQPIDAVVGYMSGYMIRAETLEEMGKRGAVIFNCCWDDKLNFPGAQSGGRYNSPAEIAGAVDLNLTNAPESVVKYAVHGGLAMFWPPGALPEIHRPYKEEFKYEVSFAGARYGRRGGFIKKLKEQGVEVECFGAGWTNGKLSREEMVRLYSQSRINLGFSGVGHGQRLLCLKGRDFEVPMSGGLYLTEDNPELSLVYEIGREIVTYYDDEDCAEKIKFLLNNPERGKEIREGGRARALKEHTWEKRFEEIFGLAGMLTD